MKSVKQTKHIVQMQNSRGKARRCHLLRNYKLLTEWNPEKCSFSHHQKVSFAFCNIHPVLFDILGGFMSISTKLFKINFITQNFGWKNIGCPGCFYNVPPSIKICKPFAQCIQDLWVSQKAATKQSISRLTQEQFFFFNSFFTTNGKPQHAFSIPLLVNSLWPFHQIHVSSFQGVHIPK